MKRSELVEELTTWLDHDYNEEADAIISFLEKAGMKPPYRPSDEKTIRCGISEWEPEDGE